MDNVDKFILKYDNLFANNCIKEILDEESYFVINTYRLFLKNCMPCGDDTTLFIVSRLAVKFSVFEKNFNIGFMRRFLMSIVSKIKGYLMAYGENGLLFLTKLNRDNLDLSITDVGIYIATINQINLDGYLNEKLKKIKEQIDKYGYYVTFYKINNYTVADIFDIYNGTLKVNLNDEEINKLYIQVKNKGFLFQKQDELKDEKAEFKPVDKSYISDEQIIKYVHTVIDVFQKNKKMIK